MPRKKANLVITNIGQLLTVAGFSQKPAIRPSEQSLGILSGPDVCIAAENEKICFVGKKSEIHESVDLTSAIEIDAREALVLPGFVDPHTHCLFAGSRENELSYKLQGLSYMEILSKGGGIADTVRQTRKASDEDIIEQTKSRLDRMTESGTTTFEIKSGYGLSLDDEIRLLSILQKIRDTSNFDIVPTLLSAHALPDEFKADAEGYIRKVVLPSANVASERKLASFFDVFMEQGVFDADQCKRMLEYAKNRGFALKIHADEFSDLGGSKMAADLRVVSADHLLCASASGLKSLAESGVISVLLPGTSLSSFAGRFADARSIIETGGAVALGTDLSPNSWIESMHFVICLACYCMKMTSSEAIVAATINAAHAVGRAGDVGSVEAGKRCDLIITNLRNYKEVPYRLGSNIINSVVKNGKVVKRS